MKQLWITGPALTTLLALRPVQKGDCVKVQPCGKACPSFCKHYGHAYKLMEQPNRVLRVDEIDTNTPPPILVYAVRKQVGERGIDAGMWVHPHNITALRVRKEKK